MKKILLILQFIFFCLIASYGQFTTCEITTSVCENDFLKSDELIEYFQTNANSNAQDSWHILYLANEIENRANTTALSNVSTHLKNTSKSTDELANQIIDAGGYTKWKLANTVAKHSNWVEITNITSKVDVLTPHVLKVETNIDGSFFPKNKNVNGQSFQMEGFKGCHSENALKEYVQVNGGTYSVKNKSIGQGGVYEGQPVINLNNKEYVKINGIFVEYEPGKLGGTSSFFPENWTNAKIKQEVEFALTNNHGKVNPLDPVDRLHFGFSSDGTDEIQFYLNTDGSIGSYFPKKR